jgi:hypothetical protein
MVGLVRQEMRGILKQGLVRQQTSGVHVGGHADESVLCVEGVACP